MTLETSLISECLLLLPRLHHTIYTFLYPLIQKGLLNAYYTPGVILGTGAITVNKTDKIPTLLGKNRISI